MTNPADTQRALSSQGVLLGHHEQLINALCQNSATLTKANALLEILRSPVSLQPHPTLAELLTRPLSVKTFMPVIPSCFMGKIVLRQVLITPITPAVPPLACSRSAKEPTLWRNTPWISGR